MKELYEGPYRGWNVKHFHEHLVRHHGFCWGYTWAKTQLQTAGLATRAARRARIATGTALGPNGFWSGRGSPDRHHG
jgi:hypothetical protein